MREKRRESKNIKEKRMKPLTGPQNPNLAQQSFLTTQPASLVSLSASRGRNDRAREWMTGRTHTTETLVRRRGRRADGLRGEETLVGRNGGGRPI